MAILVLSPPLLESQRRCMASPGACVGCMNSDPKAPSSHAVT